jgi:hypothetical protein
VGLPLLRAAVAAGVRVERVATIPGSRYLERRLKRWHKTGQFCPGCRAARMWNDGRMTVAPMPPGRFVAFGAARIRGGNESVLPWR